MNKSTNKEFSFLRNKELIQVCFGKFEIILNFDDDLSITIECPFSFLSKNKTLDWNPDDLADMPLNYLLGRKIINWEIENSKEFGFFFDSKESIKIHLSVETGYENVTISTKDEVYSF